MKSFLYCVVFTLTPLFANAARAEWDRTWWDPASGSALEAPEATARLASSALIVLGEEHYNDAVQAAEAAIVRRLEAPTLGWEFLDVIDAERVARVYADFAASATMTGAELMPLLLPQSAPAATYAPVFEALRAVSGRLVATNLSREQKRPVTRGGLAALDPALLPAGFALGDEGYRARFAVAMGGHPLPYPLENYFASQCLTDDVMAVSLLDAPATGPRVLITGSFHGDYSAGVVDRLRHRTGDPSLVYVKIVDAAGLTIAKLRDLVRDAADGPIADMVYVVGEPRT